MEIVLWVLNSQEKTTVEVHPSGRFTKNHTYDTYDVSYMYNNEKLRGIDISININSPDYEMNHQSCLFYFGKYRIILVLFVKIPIGYFPLFHKFILV